MIMCHPGDTSVPLRPCIALPKAATHLLAFLNLLILSQIARFHLNFAHIHAFAI